MEAFKKKLETLRSEADVALTRAETAERDLAAAKAEIAAKDQETISFGNRISLLESQVETAEATGGDSKNKLREVELRVEELERKIRSLEKERDTLETKLEAKTEEHAKMKSELEETLKAMDEM